MSSNEVGRESLYGIIGSVGQEGSAAGEGVGGGRGVGKPN